MATDALTLVDTNALMQKALMNHLCRTAWNMPLTECRRNITLRAISKGRSRVNVCNLEYGETILPYYSSDEKHQYYIYAAAKCCMGGLIVDPTATDVIQMLASINHIPEDNVINRCYNDGWLRLDTYLNLRPFDLRIHGIHGEWLHRNFIYIKNHPFMDMFLIVIDKTMAKTVLGDDYNFTTIYMSVYYDSDNDMDVLSDTSPMIYSYCPRTVAELNEAYRRYTEHDISKTVCFINGRESAPASLDDMHIGQYIEVVYDPDIIYSMTIDMTDPNQSYMYRSTVDNTFKYIVHIPKEINPNNYLITHNTCDMFIRPNANVAKNARLMGLFVHRFDTSMRRYTYALTTDEKFYPGKDYYIKEGNEYTKKYITPEMYSRYDGETTKLPLYTYYIRTTEYLYDSAITQITHNDFGISEKNLQPYMEFIESSECLLRVVIRKHSKAIKLDGDCNFINMLYMFDDATILKFLAGDIPEYCEFWKAVNLEQSEWAKMIFEIPSTPKAENSQAYLNALGYFNSLSVITPKVIRALHTDINVHEMDFAIPMSMITCRNVGVLLSKDGRVIPHRLYSYTRDHQYAHVIVDSSVSLPLGTRLTAELFDDPTFHAEYKEVTASDMTLNVEPFEEIELYLVKDNTTVKQDIYTDMYCQGTHKGYLKVDNEDYIDSERVVVDANDQTATRLIHFNSAAVGKKFLIVSKHLFKLYGSDEINLAGGNTILNSIPSSAGSCTTLLRSGKLTITGTSWTTGESVTVPIISPSWNIIPHCNGRELVEKVDYSYVTLKDDEDYTLYREVIFNVNAVGNAAYYDRDSYLLKDVANEFELALTSNLEFVNLFGFSETSHTIYSQTGYAYSFINEIEPYVYWYKNLCNLIGDGSQLYGVARNEGRLKIYDTLRNGAFYRLRGMIPEEAKDFVEKYISIDTDVVKMTEICRYVRSLYEVEDESIALIDHSHHITSIVLNQLIEDVVTGRKQLTYSADDNAMLRQVEEYYPLMKYDAVFSGLVSNLHVFNAGTDAVNGMYEIDDHMKHGIERTWTNHATGAKLKFRKDDNTHTYRWEILASTDILIYNEQCMYYANDIMMTHDPWELGWTTDQGQAGAPIMKYGGIDLQFVDVLPSYTSDEHIVESDVNLKRIINLLLPTDSTKDGDTTS